MKQVSSSSSCFWISEGSKLFTAFYNTECHQERPQWPNALTRVAPRCQVSKAWGAKCHVKANGKQIHKQLPSPPWSGLCACYSDGWMESMVKMNYAVLVPSEVWIRLWFKLKDTQILLSKDLIGHCNVFWIDLLHFWIDYLKTHDMALQEEAISG